MRVSVCDDSPARPRLRNYGPEAVTGRGLVIVDRIAKRWGVEPSDAGKCVWFEIEDRAASVSANGSPRGVTPRSVFASVRARTPRTGRRSRTRATHAGSGAQPELPTERFEPLLGLHKKAQAGRVDEPDRGEIDDDRITFLLREIAEGRAERRRRFRTRAHRRR